MKKKENVWNRPPHPAINIQLYLRGIERDRMMLSGPKEVFDRFNWICRELGYTKWEVLELLMLSAEFHNTQLDPSLEEGEFNDENIFRKSHEHYKSYN